MQLLTIYSAVRRGLGKHIFVFGPKGAEPVAEDYFKILFFFQLFFNFATGFTKLAMYASTSYLFLTTAC